MMNTEQNDRLVRLINSNRIYEHLEESYTSNGLVRQFDSLQINP